MTNQKTIQNEREGFEDAFINLLSSERFIDQSFYSFIIAKMNLSINKTVPTAGAGFYNNNYQLVINPDFFNPLPLEQRIGILIHETMHVILKHIFRKGERNHQLYNVAADMALNQSIKRDWLPEGAIYPDTFKNDKGNSWPSNKTAEQYYEMLKEEKEKQEQEKQEHEDQNGEPGDCDSCQGSGEQEQDCDSCQGSGKGEDGEECEDCKGSGKSNKECEDCQGTGKQEGDYQPGNGNPNLTGNEQHTLDSHDLWEQIESEDEELASQMMEKMIENAMEKTKGNMPGNISELLALWKRAPIISWKKVLKKYVSSKIGAKQATIKRRDRRQPGRMEVKGRKTSYDQPNIVVGLDTSGSMSDEEIVDALVEINEVCKITHSNLEIVQIDTVIQGSEEYDPKKKIFKRRGCGGTYMGAMPKYLKDNKVQHDVLIMISDMYIEDVATDANWKAQKKPTLWLNTSGTVVNWEGTKGHKIMDIAKA